MIGGNITATFQQKDGSITNEIGEKIHTWLDVQQLTGWLDMVSGDSKYTHNAKIQESTHIFMCDYVTIDHNTDDKRLMVNGDIFDILFIDDPMGLHQQLEIYLRSVG